MQTMAPVTYCKRGHRMTEQNRYRKPSKPRASACRACIKLRDAEWSKRKERKPPRVFARNLSPPPTDDLRWAAGLFEGEGTVTIAKTGGSSRPGLTRTMAIVGNTDIEVVRFFHERWGGTLRPRKPPTLRAKSSFEWSLAGAQAAYFLRDILPFVRTSRVRNKIDLVLRSEEIRRADPFHARHQLHRMLAEVRALNRRGA